MEQEKPRRVNLIKEYWPQLTAALLIAFAAGTNVNSLESFATKILGMEREHKGDVSYLNEEDDGVRSDFVRADECNREIAKLENEVLYWKIKYEMSN